MSENTTPGTELTRTFCAGIDLLQLCVVLVYVSDDVLNPKPRVFLGYFITSCIYIYFTGVERCCQSDIFLHVYSWWWLGYFVQL